MFFQENGQYRCAVYLRLSRSDGDQQESNSIKNQRALRFVRNLLPIARITLKKVH